MDSESVNIARLFLGCEVVLDFILAHVVSGSAVVVNDIVIV